MKNKILLLLGGAQSGKTEFAEKCGAHFSSVLYCSTLKIPDSSKYIEKISNAQCNNNAIIWDYFDIQNSISEVVTKCSAKKYDLVIIDSATFWLAKVYTSAFKNYSLEQLYQHLDKEISSFIQEISNLNSHIIITSNEVGLGVVPVQESGRIFRDYLGILNKKISDISFISCLIIVGKPILLSNNSLPRNCNQLINLDSNYIYSQFKLESK